MPELRKKRAVKRTWYHDHVEGERAAASVVVVFSSWGAVSLGSSDRGRAEGGGTKAVFEGVLVGRENGFSNAGNRWAMAERKPDSTSGSLFVPGAFLILVPCPVPSVGIVRFSAP